MLNHITKFTEYLDESRGLPKSKLMFGEFVRENEVTFLFGPTGFGKSVVGYEIALGVASGAEIIGEVNEMDEPASVLYVDAELSAQQIVARYGGRDDIPEKLFYLDIQKLRTEPGKKFEFGAKEIDELIVHTSARLCVLDNLSTLVQDPTDRIAAGDFLKEVSSIAKNRNCAVLILAHCSKLGMINREKPVPINLGMMEGSHAITSLCDHAFGISQTPDGITYLKHCKSRNDQNGTVAKLISIEMPQEGNLTVFPVGYELIDVLFPLKLSTQSSNRVDYPAIIEEILIRYKDKRTWNHNDLARAIESVHPDANFESAKKMLKVMVSQGLIFKNATKYLIVVQTETIAPDDERAFKLNPIIVDADPF